jgi:LPPG:FO 2-phospho-L-lactate transferase
MAINFSNLDNRNIVALAGGVGGAKLAHGLAEILPAGHLSVVVNVGDDFRHYGLHISPDLDTVMYTLAGIANPATGWGIVDETWQHADMMATYGEDIWFRLGDRDLATHLLRTQALDNGQTLTEITQYLAQKLRIAQRLLPATNDPLETMVRTKEKGMLPFQHYFVKYKWQPTVTELIYRGSNEAQMTAEVHDALSNADLIVLCPSNPWLSIAPILAVQEIRNLLINRKVPCIGASPLIGGLAVKGPTDKLMSEMGMQPSTVEIARFYAEIVDVLVIDEQDHDEAQAVTAAFPMISIYQTTTLMQSIEDRQILARRILSYVSEVNL